MRSLVLSARAETDLREIWRFSYDRFGEAQADRYLDELSDGLQKCSADPEGGKHRGDVRPGYGSRLLRKHVAFYTFTEEEVLVQRVLHGSMDPNRHFRSLQTRRRGRRFCSVLASSSSQKEPR